MEMIRDYYHPKAFLSKIKNVKKGLVTRTKIVSALDILQCTAKAINEKTGIHYSSILHHLHLMENENIIKRNDKKPYIWVLTGIGQKKLTEI
jgi:predicted ArsR family transcriptional regulator